MGFVQVRLEVVAINTKNIAAFVRAGKASPNISCYYLTLSKAKQQLRVEGILMPHLLQSPVRCLQVLTDNSKDQNEK